ncbi:MAG: hypothetical protein GX982_06025 [Tissierellia bacterium]|nr:hypothetical protein [Tissierellia bacterium]
MNALEVLIMGFFIAISIQKLKYLKKIKIKTKKTILEYVVVGICVTIFALIIYKFANTNIHYFIGFLGILLFMLTWYTQGITEEGFVSNAKIKEFIKWNEIDKIIIYNSDNSKIKLIGNFLDPIFYFTKEDLKRAEKLINLKVDSHTIIEKL